jgi:hypothetical protein
MRKFVQIAAALASVAALGACGGSSSSYKGLSKADFVTQAEAICTAGNTKIAKISAQFGSKEPTIAQFKSAYINQLIPIFHSEVTDLRALKPPAADRDTIKKMLDELSTGVDQAKAEVEGAKTQAELGTIKEPAGMKTASAAARAYGLAVCGSDN